MFNLSILFFEGHMETFIVTMEERTGSTSTPMEPHVSSLCLTRRGDNWTKKRKVVSAITLKRGAEAEW